MHDSHFDAFVRAVTDGSLTRRSVARALAGMTIAAGLSRITPVDGDARKRKKRKRGKKRKRRGQSAGDDAGGGGTPCGGTLCNGQCVNLNTDVNNCGACGAVCDGDGAVCAAGRCVSVFDSPGSGIGLLERPTGIAANSNGLGFVVDSGRGGVILLSGTVFGNADFAMPEGIAINSASGEVYVTDSGLQAVVRFAADGRLLGVFGDFGSGFGQLNAPLGAAVDAGNGRVFIADSGNNRIQRFSATGSPLGQLGGAGSGERQFLQPEGVTIGPNREVVVADTGNNRIQVLDQAGSFIRAFGSPGSGPGQFNRPVSVAFDRDILMVVDQGNNRIQRFTVDGKFVTAVGDAGSSPGQFNEPTGVAFADGAILVTDTGNHRVQIFSPARTGPGTTSVAGGLDQRRGRGTRAEHRKTSKRPSRRAGKTDGKTRTSSATR
jgi:DNA-binding beta-propeller fold protein YncE